MLYKFGKIQTEFKYREAVIIMKMISNKFSRLKNKFNKWISWILSGTHNHFLCFIPDSMGNLISFVLKSFFAGIRIDRLQSKLVDDIPDNAIVVYVNKYKSNFEYLFSCIRYKENNFKNPQIGFDYKTILWQPVTQIFRIILAKFDYFFHHLSFPDPYKSGYIKQELLHGRAGFLSLIEKKGFYRRFVKAKTDPIQYLINIQKTMERPIYIVPQIMFFSKKPHRLNMTLLDILFGTKEKPSSIRKIVTLFKNPGKVFLEISEPVNLMEIIKTPLYKAQTAKQQSFTLRRRLLTQINRHRQSITGPMLKSKEELKENILTEDRLQQFMHHYAKKRNIPIQKINKQADAYLDEIAAKYSSAIIKMLEMFVHWITNNVFDGITVNYDVLNKVKNMSQKGPLILLPCHKSHIDYLVLSYVMLKINMPGPHIAAGDNLSFWPLGSIFRGGGAFFIRRSFKGAAIYSKIFSEYVFKLLNEGFNIELFIEGGRSRTGKLLRPQLGLLSILLNAYKNGACEDLILAPIFIGYDRVLEEDSYINEIQGGKKNPESFIQLIKARRLLKKKYGKIYVHFHDPISLHDFLKEKNLSMKTMSSKEHNVLCRNLGQKIIKAIDNVSVITPHALVASALLNCSKKRFSFEHLMSHITTYTNFLISQNYKLTDTLILDYEHSIERVYNNYLQRKLIENSSDKKNTHSLKGREISITKRSALEYYKNSAILFFIPASFTALSILENDAFQFAACDLYSSYTFLQEFFKNEFAYDVESTPDYLVRKNIKSFIDDAIIIPHQIMPDTYNITSEGLRKLKLFSSFLTTYFESYQVVLKYFIDHPKNSTTSKERLKKIQATGTKMFKRREIYLKESLSKVNYQNAVDFFISKGIKGKDNKDKIDYFIEKINRYVNHLPQI